MIKYEFPLNERIRKFLRIEEIFKKMETQIAIRSEFSEYTCFNTYFDIVAIASRADLKIEIIQEVEKQRLKFKSKSKTKKNLSVINDLNRIRVHIEKSKPITGFNFGGDKFLHELKTRSTSPFGIVSVDFPDFQFWLQSTSTKDKKAYFKKKLIDFAAIKSAIIYLMKLLRSNVDSSSMETKTDAIQFKLNPHLKNDIVIITLGSSSNYFPNISSNKYAVNVHFATHLSNTKSKLVKFKFGISTF